MMIYNSNNIPAIHTYKDAVRYGARVLKQADIDNPDYDALELFLYVTGIDRTTYLINATDEIDNEALRKYLGYIIKDHIIFRFSILWDTHIFMEESIL